MMLKAKQSLKSNYDAVTSHMIAKTAEEAIALIRTKQLRRIEFHGRINTTKESLHQLIKEAKNYKKLDTLIIDNVHFVNPKLVGHPTKPPNIDISFFLNIFIPALNENALKVIELKRFTFQNDMFRQLFQKVLIIILRNIKVRRLRIEDVNFTKQEALIIGKLLPEIDHIEALELYDNSLKIEESNLIIEGLKANKSLLKAFIFPWKKDKKEYHISTKKNQARRDWPAIIVDIINRNKVIKVQRETKQIGSKQKTKKERDLSRKTVFPYRNIYAITKTHDVENKYYLFYDLETTGRNHCFDQIIQFSAVITDSELNVVKFSGTLSGNINFYIQLNTDTLPTTGAMITHGISLDKLLLPTNPCEYDAMRFIHKLIHDKKISTIIGYNSLQFDDKFLQHGFYRNLLMPYDKKQHIDIYPITAVYAALYPKPIDALSNKSGKLKAWPYLLSQYELKLDSINQTNDLFQTQAHDALNDVHVTIALARELQAIDTTLWHYLMTFHFNKLSDLNRLKNIKTELTQDSVCLILKNNSIHYAIFVCNNKHIRRSYWLLLDIKDFSKITTASALIDMRMDMRKKNGDNNLILVKQYLNDAKYFEQLNSKIPIKQCALYRKNIEWLKTNSIIFNEIKLYLTQYSYPEQLYVDDDAGLYLTDDLNSFSSLCHNESKKRLLDRDIMIDWDVETFQEYIIGFFHANSKLDTLIQRILCRNSRFLHKDIYIAWMKVFSGSDDPDPIIHLRDYSRGVIDFKGEEYLNPTKILHDIIFCKLAILKLIDKTFFKNTVNLFGKQKIVLKEMETIIKSKLPNIIDSESKKRILINYYNLFKNLQDYIDKKFKPYIMTLSHRLMELNDFCDEKLSVEDISKSLQDKLAIKNSDIKSETITSHSILKLLKQDLVFKPYKGHARARSTEKSSLKIGNLSNHNFDGWTSGSEPTSGSRIRSPRSSSHTTVRTVPYTAVHKDLTSTLNRL